MARYKIRSGTLSPKATTEDLFGVRNFRSILDVPTNLARFLQQLPMGAEYVADEIIFKHTLFPFFAPFLPPERVRRAIDAMISKGGRGIHNTIGITAGTLKPSKFIKFCPQCLVEDENLYGESYWHRIHQIPGITICSVHKVTLSDSLAQVRDINPHDYHACTGEVCRIQPSIVPYSARTMQELSDLSDDIVWVMSNSPSSRELTWYHRRYLDALIHKGLATPKGRVFQEELITDFKKYYSDEYLRQLQSTVAGDASSWLSSIVRSPRKASHPIRHLLVARYLFGSAECFFTSNKSYKPFGNAPWICLNGAAGHYMQPVVQKCEISYCRDTKKPVGTFYCDCGFIYSRRGPDISETDKFKVGRIKFFGQRWHDKLWGLYSTGMSFRRIAQILKVEANTVIKYINQAKTNKLLPDSKGKTEAIENETTLAEHRKTWLLERTTNPSLTKTQIRGRVPKAYMWLYRHDREWLNHNSPAFCNNYYINKRVDWNNRDKLICEKLKATVSKLMASADKPVRITKARIGKLADVLSLLEKHIDKMPRTDKYIHSVVENIQEFQIRKIRWGVKCLVERNEMLVKWKIEKLAGLRKGYSPQVEKYIETILENDESVQFSNIELESQF